MTMTEDRFTTYLSLGGVAALLMGAAILVALFKRRGRKWHMSITLHLIQLALLCTLVLTLRHLALLLVHDEAADLGFISERALNLTASFAIICLVLNQLFELINRLVRRQIQKGSDPTSSRVLSRVLKVAIALTFLFLFGEHFGIGISGLLAFGGLGGIAIGLAGQNILSNFFSGMMLYFDRPFNIGDWVRSPDRKIEGVVSEIGWRITKIITFDNRPLYVPNSLFTSISVENPSRMTNRRISTTLGLRYEDADKIGPIIEDVRKMLQGNDKIDQTQDLLVYFNAFGESSLNIMVYCFTKTTGWAAWLQAQQEVYLKLIEIVHGHGADFAFPSQTLYVEGEPATRPAAPLSQ